MELRRLSPQERTEQDGSMSDIAELERRITAALDRASQALEHLGGVPSDTADLEAMKAELEAERVANAQLEERVRAIKDKQETTLAALEAEVVRLKEAVRTRDGEVQRMRSVNAELRDSNGKLRAANAEGLADAGLVNGAMASELEGLRAEREAQRAEIDEVLATLEPLLKEA
jgi:chromosome segregation ATPase